jgi:hypothetical protein
VAGVSYAKPAVKSSSPASDAILTSAENRKPKQPQLAAKLDEPSKVIKAATGPTDQTVKLTRQLIHLAGWIVLLISTVRLTFNPHWSSLPQASLPQCWDCPARLDDGARPLAEGNAPEPRRGSGDAVSGPHDDQ